MFNFTDVIDRVERDSIAADEAVAIRINLALPTELLREALGRLVEHVFAV